MTEKNIEPAQPIFAPISVISNPYENKTHSADGRQSAIGVPIAAIPKGYKLKSLKAYFEDYRTKPERRTGTITVKDWESFIAFLDRYCNDSTTVGFQDGKKVTVIFDYYPPGPELDQTGCGDFRLVYKHKDLKPIGVKELRIPIYQGKEPS
jgi:hypothetical protein